MMTRHARIKSIHQKSSFNKIAEDPTPWEELKRPVERNDSDEETDVIEEPVKVKSEPKFVPVNTSWGEIEAGSKSEKKQKKKNKIDSKDSIENPEVSCSDVSEVKSTMKKNKKKLNEFEESHDVSTKKKNKKKNSISEPNLSVSEEFVNKKKSKLANDSIEGCDVSPESKKRKKFEDNEGNHNLDSNNSAGEDHHEKTFKRKKTEPEDTKIMIDGEEVTVSRFEGFPVLETDKKRLTELKKKLEKQNIPKDRIFFIIKKERRMAEKKLSKYKKTLCFNCRGSGHSLTECPKLTSTNQQPTAVGICYKCGSTEHTLFQCKVPGNDLKFATCFICKEQGHLSKNCPDNPKGLYPQGGGCRFCGDVTHYREDCPKNLKKKEVQKPTYTVSTFRNPRLDNVEDDLSYEKANKEVKKDVFKPKKVYFN